MKTIHALFTAAALAIAPFGVFAQTVPTDADATDATGEAESADSTTGQVAEPTGSDIGSTGTGTGTSDIGSTGTGTGTNDIGSTGTGTGTVQSTAPSTTTVSSPAVSLVSRSTSLRTPGSMQVTVTLAANPGSSDPPRDIVVPLASSSASCVVPASVIVGWTAAAGGTTSVNVACSKAGAQTVTISSGTASTSFSVR